jgi:hypothetical protein
MAGMTISQGVRYRPWRSPTALYFFYRKGAEKKIHFLSRTTAWTQEVEQRQEQLSRQKATKVLRIQPSAGKNKIYPRRDADDYRRPTWTWEGRITHDSREGGGRTMQEAKVEEQLSGCNRYVAKEGDGRTESGTEVENRVRNGDRERRVLLFIAQNYSAILRLRERLLIFIIKIAPRSPRPCERIFISWRLCGLARVNLIKRFLPRPWKPARRRGTTTAPSARWRRG